MTGQKSGLDSGPPQAANSCHDYFPDDVPIGGGVSQIWSDVEVKALLHVIVTHPKFAGLERDDRNTKPWVVALVDGPGLLMPRGRTLHEAMERALEHLL